LYHDVDTQEIGLGHKSLTNLSIEGKTQCPKERQASRIDNRWRVCLGNCDMGAKIFILLRKASVYFGCVSSSTVGGGFHLLGISILLSDDELRARSNLWVVGGGSLDRSGNLGSWCRANKSPKCEDCKENRRAGLEMPFFLFGLDDQDKFVL
jgi:hypothetical protein